MTLLLRTALVLLLVCPAITAQDEDDIQVRAVISSRVVTQEDLFQLAIEISGSSMIEQAEVQMPNLDSLRLVSQSRRTNTQIFNGQVTSSLQYLYFMVPTTTGRITIPAIDVVYSGKTYTTDPIQIEVQQSQQSGDIMPLLSVDDPQVYIGEQVNLETSLMFSTNVRVRHYEMTDSPDLRGFINIPDPTLTRQERTMVDRDQESFLKFTLARNILFPLSAGEKRIEGVPFQIQYNRNQINSGLKFASRTAEDLILNVLPLPDGAPDNFGGAVGQFQISWQIDRREGKAQEPFTLKVELRGYGDIERVPEADLNVPDTIEVISVKNEARTSYINGRWGGRRTWEYILVPSEEGLEQIGPVEYSFFNPETESYEISRTESIPLTLQKADVNAQAYVNPDARPDAQEEDIRYLKEIYTTVPESRMPSLWLIVLLLGAPLAINLATILFKSVLKSVSGWTTGPSRGSALKMAVKKLKSLPETRRKPNQEQMNIVADAITSYFSQRLQIPSPASMSSIRDSLKRADLHESKELKTLQQIMEYCTASKYSPVAQEQKHLSDIIEETKSALAEIDRRLS